MIFFSKVFVSTAWSYVQWLLGICLCRSSVCHSDTLQMFGCKAKMDNLPVLFAQKFVAVLNTTRTNSISPPSFPPFYCLCMYLFSLSIFNKIIVIITWFTSRFKLLLMTINSAGYRHSHWSWPDLWLVSWPVKWNRANSDFRQTLSDVTSASAVSLTRRATERTSGKLPSVLWVAVNNISSRSSPPLNLTKKTAAFAARRKSCLTGRQKNFPEKLLAKIFF